MAESRIVDSVKRLDDWITSHDFKAYDPFDGLSARLLGLDRLRNHYLKIILQQSVRRLPINVRPLLGIQPNVSSKGMAFCALGYLKLFKATGNSQYRQRLHNCLGWLMKNYSSSFSGRSWGNHFNYASRGGAIPKGFPTIVWTSLIANAFLDVYEELGNAEYLETARASGEFILNDISRYEADDGSICFMYVPHKKNNLQDQCVHNSNVLGACLLSRLYKHTGDTALLDLSKRSIAFTARRQLDNGAWNYGEPRKFHWVDSFHTGYVLESMHGYRKATNDDSYDVQLAKGYQFFLGTFFEKDGTPRYYDHKRYPIDIQCASQGVQTLVNLREHDSASMELAARVAEWTIENMQDRDGHFYFRKYPLIVNKTPMFHWGQATMLAALGALIEATPPASVS